DHGGVRLRDVHPHLADEIVWKAAAAARPVIAAVGGLVDAAFGGRPAADDRPPPALGAPGAGIELVRIAPVDRDRDGPGLLVAEQRLLPAPPTAPGPVDAAIRAPAERVAHRRDVGEVRILRVNLQLTDLPDFAETSRLPCLACIGRLEHAAPEDHVRADRFAAG